MNFVLQPWWLLVAILVGWVDREQQAVIEYPRTENAILRELQGKKRLLLNDDQRRRLAVKGKLLGRKAMEQVGTLFTPDTILRWHRMLVAKKWNHAEKWKTQGRPPVPQEVADLVLKFASENPTWGYDRIADALGNVGHTISDQSVGNILKANGIEPAPTRRRTMTWNTFLKAHWDQLAAIDFTTVEVWTKNGLITFYLLFAIHLAMRRVKFVGCTPNPTGPKVENMAKELTNFEDGFLRAPYRYVLMDRDTKFTEQFKAILKSESVEPVLLPQRSPNCNAWIERFFRSLKSEALDRMIFFREDALRRATEEFMAHYHAERNHQGLDHKIIEPDPDVGKPADEIVCRDRLGGRLKNYHRCAA